MATPPTHAAHLLTDAGDDRRDAPRRMLRRVATLLLPGNQTLDVRTIDISTGGMGIIASANPPIGMACGLRVALPGGTAGTVTLELRVKVRQSMFSAKDDGFKVGLGFVDLNPAHERSIRQYVES